MQAMNARVFANKQNKATSAALFAMTQRALDRNHEGLSRGMGHYKDIYVVMDAINDETLSSDEIPRGMFAACEKVGIRLIPGHALSDFVTWYDKANAGQMRLLNRLIGWDLRLLRVHALAAIAFQHARVSTEVLRRAAVIAALFKWLATENTPLVCPLEGFPQIQNTCAPNA
jgi:hypothetical protein